MELRERVYSALVVSASDRFSDALAPLLPESFYEPVCQAAGAGAAQRMLCERSFDFILINAPLPDGQAARFAAELCDTGNAAVLLLVKNELYAQTLEQVVRHGVFVLGKPVSRASISQALDWMAGMRERLRRFEKKTLSIEEKMEEIRLVNRAKWLLISELKMSEPEAHRYIEKQAMDRCVSKKTIAQEVLTTYQ